MKMTDESALAVMQFARGYLTWNNMQEFDDALQHIRARLAADQQKGGGEVVKCSCTPIDYIKGRACPDCIEQQEGPQPSIPAPAQRADEVHADAIRIIERDWFDYVDGPPAQQDGKASGGAVAWLRAKADEQDANNARWPEHAKCYPQWQLMPVIARQLAAQLELAHPPHADQETQG